MSVAMPCGASRLVQKNLRPTRQTRSSNARQVQTQAAGRDDRQPDRHAGGENLSKSDRMSARQVNNAKENSNSAMTSSLYRKAPAPSTSYPTPSARVAPSPSMPSMRSMPSMPSMPSGAQDDDEEILRVVDHMNMGSTTRAVILAGGEQKNPLTQYRAMPAVPIGSCMMLIDVPINNCLGAGGYLDSDSTSLVARSPVRFLTRASRSARRSLLVAQSPGINKMYVMTQFQSHQLNSHIASAYPPQGFGARQSGWVDLLAAQQTINGSEWYKGSADALRRNLMELKDEARGVEPADDYVILSGSAMYNMDIARVVGYHRIKKADITICSHMVDANEAKVKGVIVADAVGRVSGFHEKPGEMVGDFVNEDNQARVNMGVYVFKRDAMLRLLEDDAGLPMDHIGHHMIPAALAGGARVFTYLHHGYWKDVSSLRDYYEANIALTSKSKAPIKFFELERAISAKKGKMLPPARLCGSVTVDQSILGDGAILCDGCVSRRSIIGENVLVGTGSTIEESLLLGSRMWTSETQRAAAKARGDLIYGVGSNVHLKGCVVDENAYIGDGCIVRNDAGVMEADGSKWGYMIHEGIVVVLKNAVIPDGTVI